MLGCKYSVGWRIYCGSCEVVFCGQVRRMLARMYGVFGAVRIWNGCVRIRVECFLKVGRLNSCGKICRK